MSDQEKEKLSPENRRLINMHGIPVYDAVLRGQDQHRAAALMNRLLNAAREDAYKQGWNDREDDLIAGVNRLGAPSTEPEPVQGAPIDMVLFCPRCGVQHIDEPSAEWDNPPHRSHLCLACHFVWRPADVATNGVSATKTRGSRDSALSEPVQELQGVGELVEALEAARRSTPRTGSRWRQISDETLRRAIAALRALSPSSGLEQNQQDRASQGSVTATRSARPLDAERSEGGETP